MLSQLRIYKQLFFINRLQAILIPPRRKPKIWNNRQDGPLAVSIDSLSNSGSLITMAAITAAIYSPAVRNMIPNDVG